VTGLRVWILGFGVWVLGSGFWVLCFGFWIVKTRRLDLRTSMVMGVMTMGNAVFGIGDPDGYHAQ
jgi:hypothetical protein